MKIYLLSTDIEMCEAWKQAFRGTAVTVCHMRLARFMEKHPEVKCIVTPGNSTGYMDGGFDAALVRIFGNKLQDAVREDIRNKYHGKQPVGTVNDVPVDDYHILYVPSMEYPDIIRDDTIISLCTENALEYAKIIQAESIVIPAIGAGTGGVEPETVAKQMRNAVDSVIYAWKQPDGVELPIVRAEIMTIKKAD